MIAAVDFDSPEVQALALAQQREIVDRFGTGDIGPSRDGWMFAPPDGVFLVALEDGVPVACGGVCRFDERRGELKRMYVLPERRGSGLGRAILVELEHHARELGYAALVLETGDYLEPALGLYRSAGYEPIPCYGAYADRESSVCFEKRLA